MRINETDLRFTFCRTKRDVFTAMFPGGAEVSVANATRATRAGLSLRCAAEQLMEFEQLTDFQQRAREMLNAYFNATADTRHALQSVKMDAASRTEWQEADEAHSANKNTHWPAYLDGLAEAFVECLTSPVAA